MIKPSGTGLAPFPASVPAAVAPYREAAARPSRRRGLGHVQEAKGLRSR